MNANANPAGDLRLDALDAAAVGLLEPLIVAMPFDAGAARDEPVWDETRVARAR